jgi:hypothetical protein
LLVIYRGLTGWLIADLEDCVSFFCLSYIFEAPSAFSSIYTAISTSLVFIVLVVLVTR